MSLALHSEDWRKIMTRRRDPYEAYYKSPFFVQQQKGLKKRWREYENGYGAGFTHKKWWYRWGWSPTTGSNVKAS